MLIGWSLEGPGNEQAIYVQSSFVSCGLSSPRSWFRGGRSRPARACVPRFELKQAAACCFEEKSRAPAWKVKPSWYQISAKDRLIPTETEKWMAERINARRTYFNLFTKGTTHETSANHDGCSAGDRKRMDAAGGGLGKPRTRAPNENAKEQSYMKDEKVLIQAKIQPQRRAELIDALSAYLPLVRAEPGVNAFYVTTQKDDQIRLFFPRSTSRKLHRISICSRIHEEILGDAQGHTGSRPRADKSH